MILPANLVAFASFAFGVGAKQIWANESADVQNIIMTAYPVGNGYMGGEVFQLVFPFPNSELEH